ncbi:hypothetical protein BC827DRAFT_624632 [Russula dissimulans]|nr:hypothetical protein BC827DRAFT_624632 [Russula dissimulans]
MRRTAPAAQVVSCTYGTAYNSHTLYRLHKWNIVSAFQRIKRNPLHHSLSSSIDVGAICRFSSTLMIPTVGNSERSTVQDIFTPFPHGSSEHREPARGENFRHATIEMLPENTLLEIFDFYRLNAMKVSYKRELPWKWPRLARVCRKWRQVLSMSPRRLA